MDDQSGFILVTGSSGRIGKSVIQRLGGKYPIVGFDTVAPPHKNDNLEFIKVDLTSPKEVADGLALARAKYGSHIISVIHLAAYYSFSGEDSPLYQTITIEGTQRLLQGVKQFKTEQFLFSSTELVYAPCKVGETINEQSPILPQWAYPKSKVATEKLIHEQRGSIPSVILQIAGCYDDKCHCIPLANQIQRIYEKQYISRLYPGDITHGNPFLHFDDLAEAIWLAVEKRAVLPSEIKLLIGENKTMSYDEIQREISSQLGEAEFTTFQIPKWLAKIGAWTLNHTPFVQTSFVKPWMIDLANDHYALDISQAHDELGWWPKNFVGDVIPKMIQSLKSNPYEWYKTNQLAMPKEMKNENASLKDR